MDRVGHRVNHYPCRRVKVHACLPRLCRRHVSCRRPEDLQPWKTARRCPSLTTAWKAVAATASRVATRPCLRSSLRPPVLVRAQVPRRRRLLQARPSRSPRRRNGTHGSASMWDLDARARGGLEVDPRCNSGDLSRVRAEAVDGRNNRDSQYSVFWQYVSREAQGGTWPADTRCALWRHFNVWGMSLQNGWHI